MSGRIHDFFETITKMRVLVVGDVMVDSYLMGNVKRISPEAPVPIVEVKQRDHRLGGAANVAMNIKSLGAQAVLCSVIGNDDEATHLLNLMQQANLPTDGIVKSPDRITTIKHRIISGSHHLLRIDSETTQPITTDEQERLLRKVTTLLDSADVLIFEDYDKGVLCPEVISHIIQTAQQKGVPTAVDPKINNFMAYAGATLFKPNLRELAGGLKTDLPAGDIKAITEAVKHLHQLLKLDVAFVTLSEHGVLIYDGQTTNHISAFLRNIADVSGAGDTVISIAALALAAGLPPSLLAAIANLGGGLVCERVGVVPIERHQLMDECLKFDLFAKYYK